MMKRVQHRTLLHLFLWIALLPFFLGVLLFSPESIQAENGKLELNIAFIGNWFFDKYDVELFIGTTQITTIKHGKDYSGTVSVSTGSQNLIFYKKGNHKIFTSQKLVLSEDCSFSCTIQVYGKEIEIKDVTFIDYAAEKKQKEEESRTAESRAAEKAKKEEESRAAEQALKEELDITKDDLKKVLSVTDPSDACLQEFADRYKGNKIQFDGHVAYIRKQENNQVYLIRARKYEAHSLKGPDFQIVSKAGSLAPGNKTDKKLSVGMNLTVTAEVVSYDPTAFVFTITPINLKWLSSNKLTELTDEDYAAKTTVKEIQEALNRFGFDCGKADGNAGPRTNAAISKFRESRNLGNSSEIDAELAAYLRVNVLHADIAATEKKPAETKADSTKTARETTAAKKTETTKASIEKSLFRLTTLYSATTTVNVRNKPSTDGEKIGKYYKYDFVYVYEISNGWAEIDYDGKTGYVSADYLQKGTIDIPENTRETVVTRGDSGGGVMVWIPNSGSKYHSRKSCSGMKNPKQVTISEAISMGYTACKKCN